MNKADQEFNDECKPISVPAHYHTDASEQDKVIYCLGDIESGTAYRVANKIHEYEPTESVEQIQEYTRKILLGLYDKGLIKGEEQEGEITFNLSKIITPNKGRVNPDLMA